MPCHAMPCHAMPCHAMPCQTNACPQDRADDATGEVFGGLPVPDGANDGAALMAALGEQGSSVAGVLSRLRGPWALVYWHAPSQTLWFGRDAVGKLLTQLPTGDSSTPWQAKLHQSAACGVPLSRLWVRNEEESSGSCDCLMRGRASRLYPGRLLCLLSVGSVGRRSLLMRRPTAGRPSFSLASAAGSGAGSGATIRSPPQDAGGTPEAEPPEATPPCSPNLQQPAGGAWQAGLPCCPAACMPGQRIARALWMPDMRCRLCRAQWLSITCVIGLCLQEVEPGVYSVSFGRGDSLQTPALDISRPEWLDPAVLRLAAYKRDASLIRPPATPPDEAADQAACSVVGNIFELTVDMLASLPAPGTMVVLMHFPTKEEGVPAQGCHSGVSISSNCQRAHSGQLPSMPIQGTSQLL